MSSQTEAFIDYLAQAGCNLTKPRLTVFHAMQGSGPLTMHELVGRCEEVDRATVYRTVGLFEELGIVERLQTGWKYRLELSGLFHDHHHHATCLHCGISLPLPEDILVEEQLIRLARGHGFHMQRHQLELQGLCAACEAQEQLLQAH
ncbi:transcriptional repressor [Candidatus Saccharibacteria bacterium]|nr:MAG: transcriptional repressor [Candidatus Saccharibacteria bacterium]